MGATDATDATDLADPTKLGSSRHLGDSRHSGDRAIQYVFFFSLHASWAFAPQPPLHGMANVRHSGYEVQDLSRASTACLLTVGRELYMKTGQGFLLVFSITSQSSFYELAELREQIRRIKEDNNVPMVLIGNKSDLEDDRAIPRPRAFAISRDWNIPYFETSARRRANVDEAFVDLCRQIMRKDQNERRHAPLDSPRPGRGTRPGRTGAREAEKRKHRPKCTIL